MRISSFMVQKYFGDIPTKKAPPRNDVLEFERVGYRHMEIESTVQVPNLYMAWNVRSLATAKDPQDAYALNIIRSILDSGISSRFHIVSYVHSQSGLPPAYLLKN